MAYPHNVIQRKHFNEDLGECSRSVQLFDGLTNARIKSVILGRINELLIL